MRFKLVLPFVLWLVLSASTALAADNYEIDPAHTRIGFSVRHMMISNVAGRFLGFKGAIQYDPQDITKSSVSVKIDSASVSTDNNNRDNDLRSPNFFDAAKFPEITFQSSRIEKRGEGYVCIGTLAIHGVSKEVSIPFTIFGQVKDPRGNTHMGLEGGLTIDRRDFGMNYARTIDNGGLMVGNDVKVELSVEAVNRQAPPPGGQAPAGPRPPTL